MKPAAFKFFAPNDPDAVVEALAHYGDAAKILAGGQSLVPLLNMRLANPEVLIDINRVRAWNSVRVSPAGHLIYLPLVRHQDLESDRIPLLRAAAALVGHPQIRTRGTFLGSLAHADPAAELPAAFAALEGRILARGPKGDRFLSSESFFLAPLTTSLDGDEMVVEAHLVPPPEHSGWAFEEVAMRGGDYALAAVAVVLEFEVDRVAKIKGARIALAGVGPTVMRARNVEAVLVGEDARAETWHAAGNEVLRDIDPADDLQASAAHRREVASWLTERALANAWRRRPTPSIRD